jgi:hypothetical protein
MRHDAFKSAAEELLLRVQRGRHVPIHMEAPVPQAQHRHDRSPGDASHGSRRQREEWALTMDAPTLSHIQFGFVIGLQILWSSLTLGVGLWRCVVPRYPNVWSALSDGVTLSCASIGFLVILPITLGYVGHGCWALGGRAVLEGGWGTPMRQMRRQVWRSGRSDRTCGSRALVMTKVRPTVSSAISEKASRITPEVQVKLLAGSENSLGYLRPHLRAQGLGVPRA